MDDVDLGVDQPLGVVDDPARGLDLRPARGGSRRSGADRCGRPRPDRPGPGRASRCSRSARSPARRRRAPPAARAAAPRRTEPNSRMVNTLTLGKPAATSAGSSSAPRRWPRTGSRGSRSPRGRLPCALAFHVSIVVGQARALSLPGVVADRRDARRSRRRSPRLEIVRRARAAEIEVEVRVHVDAARHHDQAARVDLLSVLPAAPDRSSRCARHGCRDRRTTASVAVATSPPRTAAVALGLAWTPETSVESAARSLVGGSGDAGDRARPVVESMGAPSSPRSQSIIARSSAGLGEASRRRFGLDPRAQPLWGWGARLAEPRREITACRQATAGAPHGPHGRAGHRRAAPPRLTRRREQILRRSCRARPGAGPPPASTRKSPRHRDQRVRRRRRLSPRCSTRKVEQGAAPPTFMARLRSSSKPWRDPVGRRLRASEPSDAGPFAR